MRFAESIDPFDVSGCSEGHYRLTEATPEESLQNPARAGLEASGKEHTMKVGIALMLGLQLAFVLAFAPWLRTSHPTSPGWQGVLDRQLAQVD